MICCSIRSRDRRLRYQRREIGSRRRNYVHRREVDCYVLVEDKGRRYAVPFLVTTLLC